MPPDLVTVPCLADNYAFLLHDRATGATAAIDVPDPGAVTAALAERGWGLTEIWLTHHHGDHIAGAPALAAATGARITGAAADAHRLPPLDRAVAPGETFDFAGHPVHVIDASGHTVGHLAYHVPGADVAFTGDSLMGAGCGRMFEGTAPMFLASLRRLAALPADTFVASGHEYTAANLRFALSLEPARPSLILRIGEVAALRAAGKPTIPSRLSVELETNPYLRVADPALKARMGMPDATDAAVFAAIRTAKDKF